MLRTFFILQWLKLPLRSSAFILSHLNLHNVTSFHIRQNCGSNATRMQLQWVKLVLIQPKIKLNLYVAEPEWNSTQIVNSLPECNSGWGDLIWWVLFLIFLVNNYTHTVTPVNLSFQMPFSLSLMSYVVFMGLYHVQGISKPWLNI